MADRHAEEDRLIRQYEEAHHAYLSISAAPTEPAKADARRALHAAQDRLYKFWAEQRARQEVQT